MLSVLSCAFLRYRRLTLSLAIVALLASVTIIHNRMVVVGSPGPTTVGIVQTPSYPVSDSDLEAMVREAVAKAGGLDGIISSGDVVVVKPNIVETTWASGSGVVTDIRVVRAVVRMAQEAGAGQVIIAEGTAAYRYGEGSDRFCTKKAFKDCGLDLDGNMIDDATGVQLFDLNLAGGIDNPDPQFVTSVTLQDGLLRTQYYAPNILLTCDALISVPIFKNHANAGVTGSLKNRVGCAPNDLYHAPGSIMMKSGLVHYNSPYSENETVARSTVDLNRVRPADFTIVDALIGITNGPTGTTKPNPYVRCMMAGRDATAVDVIQTLMMGYDPQHIRTLVLAQSIGFGQGNPAFITVAGKSVAEVRNLFPDGYGGAVRVELVAPAITNLDPPDGSLLSGVVPISVTATDNMGVVKAEMYVDGILSQTDTTAPWEFQWDTNGIPDGEHEVKVKVYDAALNEATAVRSYIVSTGWDVSINASGGGFSDTFTLGAKNGAVDGVDAYDVAESTSFPYISLATLMGSTYYAADYKSPLAGTGDIREWNVHLRTDVDPAASPIVLDWSGVDWSTIAPTFELHLIDRGTSWTSVLGMYNMRDTSSVSLPVSGTGLVRCLTVRAVHSPMSAISRIKYLPDGHPVELVNQVVTAGNDQFLNTFYVADTEGISGIRVSHGAGAAPVVSHGNMVTVRGNVSTYYGERVVINPTVTVLATGNPLPRTRAMPNRSVGGQGLGEYVQAVPGSAGPNNVGLPIRTWGRVSNVDTVQKSFYINDGSGRFDASGTPGIKVHCGGRVSSSLELPPEGSFAVVTGVSTVTTSNSSLVSIIRPRQQADFVIQL